MEGFLNQLMFSYEVFGSIEIDIKNWHAKTILEDGEVKFFVKSKRGHKSKKVYIKHDGTVGYFGNPIPEYVLSALAHRIFEIKQEWKSQLSQPL
jgi:hypothetical protein